MKKQFKKIIEFFKGIKLSTIYKFVGLALLVAILFWIYITWKGQNSIQNQTNDTYINGKVTNKGNDYIIVEDENQNEYKIPSTEDVPIGSAIQEDKEEEQEQVEAPKTIMSSDVTVTNEKVENKNADADVIAYFNETESTLKDPSLKEEVKSRFITIVDFLFYDGTIKGYTLNDLSSKAKLQILKIALAIDSKIENYIPGYKETITSTTGKVYTGVKTKIIESYLKITTKICSYDEDTCNQAKKDFQDMKKSFSITWNLIKGLVSSGAENLKEWYEIFSGK